MVSFIVGPSETRFNVHEDILDESVILSEMATREIAQGERKVYLQEEAASNFGCILQYLYGGDFSFDGIDPAEVDRLIEIYIMADTFVLEDLKPVVVRKFQKIPLEDPEVILSTTDRIYEGVHKADQTYRQYFQSIAPKMMLNLGEDSLEVVRPYLSQGGNLAEDIFEAQIAAEKLRKPTQGGRTSDASKRKRGSQG